MSLLDVLTGLAVTVAGVAVWTGGRGGVAWPPGAVASLFLGIYGLSRGDAEASVLSLVVTCLTVVLPIQLLASARRASGRGDLAGAARRARWLYRIRRHPAAAEWALGWEAAAAFYAGDPVPARARADILAARLQPGDEELRDSLLAAIRDWESVRHSRALGFEVRARCELGEVDQAVLATGRAWGSRRGMGVLRIWGLMLGPLAFAGRTTDVERVADILRLPRPIRALWRAVALAASGAPERARETLARLHGRSLPAGLAAAVSAREEALPEPATLSEEARALLEQASLELRAAHLIRPRVPWRSPAALLLLLALLAGFAAQGAGARAARTLAEWSLAVGPGTPLEPSRLWTYGWLHVGLGHLLSNVVGVALAGPVVAGGLGAAGLFAVFLLGMAGAGWTAWLLSSPGYVVGASGGAMALLGAAVAMALRHPDTRGTLTARVAVRAVALLAAAQFTFDALIPRVSLSAHLGGALTGLALGALWVTIRPRR